MNQFQIELVVYKIPSPLVVDLDLLLFMEYNVFMFLVKW